MVILVYMSLFIFKNQNETQGVFPQKGKGTCGDKQAPENQGKFFQGSKQRD